MADVFLSYATPDRPFAERLAGALSQQGWTVWWDRNIAHGKDFNQVIQSELDAAKCIVVLWSAAAVQSKFVRDEATEGMHDGRLVPVLIEQVRQPLGFRQTQAADLTDWRPGERAQDFGRLLQSIAAVLHAPVSVAAVSPPRRGLPTKAIALSVVVTLLLAVGLWGLSSRRQSSPTPTEPAIQSSPVVAAPTAPPMKNPGSVAQVPPAASELRVTQAPPPPGSSGSVNQGLPPSLDGPARADAKDLPEAPPISSTAHYRVKIGTFDRSRANQIERDLRDRRFPVRARPFGSGQVAISIEPYRGFDNAIEAHGALQDLGYGGGTIEVIP